MEAIVVFPKTIRTRGECILHGGQIRENYLYDPSNETISCEFPNGSRILIQGESIGSHKKIGSNNHIFLEGLHRPFRG